MAEKCSLK